MSTSTGGDHPLAETGKKDGKKKQSQGRHQRQMKRAQRSQQEEEEQLRAKKMYGDKNDREDEDNNVYPHAAEEAHFSSVSSFPRPEQQHMRTASTPMTPPPIYLCDFICGVPLLHILTQIVMGKAFDQTTTWPTMLLFSIWLACAINWYYWRLAMWLALGTWHR